MNEKQLKIFIAVADCGSFSRSEEKTFLSKQAQIKQIDLLEMELGFSLFTRTPKGCELTPAGKEYYKGAKKILELHEAVAEKSRKLADNRNVLRIANPPHPRLVLADAMSEFSRRWPNVQQVVTFDGGKKIIDDIIVGDVDVGECIFSGTVRRPELGFTKLSDLPFFCVMQPTHPLASRERIEVSDLSGNLIGIRGDGQRELVNDISASCVNVNIHEYATDEVKCIYNICFNNGVYIAKAYYIHHLYPLVCLPLDVPYRRTSVLVYRREPSELVKKFIAVVEELREKP